jgi:biotin carboxylase
MKRVLLLGSSFSAMPFLVRLHDMGYSVSVCGKHQEDPCHDFADRSYLIDYASPEAILSIAQEGDYRFIVPTCNDVSYLSGAWVAEKLGMPGYDSLSVSKKLHLKSEFRQFTSEKYIPAPFAIAHSVSEPLPVEEVDLPVLVKPVDNFSGNGMTLVRRQSELCPAISRAAQATRKDLILLEEYVSGTLHSHSAFIRGGKILIDFFVDEYCTVYPYQVNCSNHPSALSRKIQAEVRDSIETLINELSLVDGLLHTQFIQDGCRHWVIECMRRCPGDLYGQLIEKSTGFDYCSNYLHGFLGSPLGVHEVKDYRYMSRHTVSSDRTQMFASFTHKIPSSDVSVYPLKRSGHRLREAPYDKVAILFAEFQDRAVMESVTKDLHNFVTIDS